MDGFDIAALDTLPHGLPGNAPAAHGLVHGEIPLGRFFCDTRAQTSLIARLRLVGVAKACAMMRARMLRASARASAVRSSLLGAGCVGRGGSRKARVSCIATLLIGRRLRLWNHAAPEESVDDRLRVEQIGERGEARIAMVRPRMRPVLDRRRPVCPTGRNERAAAVRKHHQQQQHAAALNGAHHWQ
jgi:hypothetical protein